MFAPAILFLALLTQEPESLEIGKPIEGAIGVDSAVVQTPTLDADYTDAPTVGNSYSVRVPKAGTYTIELRSYDFDAYLVITDEDGLLLAEDDDGLINSHARVALNLKAKNHYVVRACALWGERGGFQLRLLAGSPKPISAEEQHLAMEDDLKAELAYLEQTLGKETEKYARVLGILGVQYFSHGDIEKAKDAWRSCQAILEGVPGSSPRELANILYNLGYIHQFEGGNEEARQFYERSLAIVEEAFGPEDPETATSLNDLAMLLDFQGKLEDALPLYERALAIREKVLGSEDPETAASLNNLAALLESIGDYEKARQLHERALAISEIVLGPDHPETAGSLNNLAGVLVSLGRYEEARPLYERSLAILEKALGPERANLARNLSNLASLLKSQGKNEEARPLLERALAISEEVVGPVHPLTGTILNNLGWILEFQGEYEKARRMYERALAISNEVFGHQHSETAHNLGNLAHLHQVKGDFEVAFPLFKQALAINKAIFGFEHPETARSLTSLANLLDIQGKFEEAQRLYEQALAIREKVFGREHPDTIMSQDILANFHGVQGRYAEALSLYLQAISGSLAYLDRELPSMSESGRIRLLKISANPESLLKATLLASNSSLPEAYSIFQQWKGMATRLQSAGVRLSQSSDNPGVQGRKLEIQILAKELSGLILEPLASQAEGHTKKINSLREKRLRLERELNRKLGLDIVLATSDLKEVQAGLPSGAVLLDFFVGREVYAWVMKSSGEPMLISLGEQATLRIAQNAFLSTAAVRGGRKLSASETDPAADYLALVWNPLQEAVGDSKTVFISPDGFLCELPFGILQEADGGYLLEKHRFVYLSDPTSLAEKVDSSKVDEGSLFAVGGVNYFRRDDVPEEKTSSPTTRSRVGGAWNSLPATRDEMQSLRDLHDFVLEWESPMTVVEGKAATEERIRAELPGKRYVHIATHGYFEPDHLPSLLLDAEEKQSQAQLGEQIQAVGLLPGLLSGLVFAGVNGEADPNRDDGYLSAEEIQHLDLSACDLVVLSACETALGSARAGEGLMSLRRSFSVAGADTVISSLWKVDDKATAQLMKDFYTNLWQKGMSRGQALHESKLRMLRRNRIDNGGDALPSTWGAFVLSGEWN